MIASRGKNHDLNQVIIPLITENRVLTCGIILCELLIGARAEQEYELIADNFDGFEMGELDEQIFRHAGRLGYELKRNGLTIPLTDLLLASVCLQHDVGIWTFDHHFTLISEHTGLKLNPCEVRR